MKLSKSFLPGSNPGRPAKKYMWKKIKLLSKEFILRGLIVTLLVWGIYSEGQGKFYFILASGIISGIYYGLYNDVIWRPNGKLEPSIPYRTHQLWIHILCSLTGSISLYYLLNIINFNNLGQTLERHGFNLLALSFVTIMGYIGLLPRLLWFTSYGLGQFGKPPGVK